MRRPRNESDVFKRNDPAFSPRPPDVAGTGLDAAIESPTPGQRHRVLPDDAVVEIWRPGEADRRADFTKVLLTTGALREEQLDEARRLVEGTPGRTLMHALLSMGIDEVAVQEAVAASVGMQFLRVNVDDVDAEAFDRLGVDFCLERAMLPLREATGRHLVGTTMPSDAFVVDEVRARLGVTSVKHVLLAPGDLEAAIETLRESRCRDADVEAILADVDEEDVSVVQAPTVEDDDDADASPVVRYVNHIIQTAVREGASDIHIEPSDGDPRVRFRIDGVLHEAMSPPRRMQASITSRLKIMASLDIAGRRLPQDGRIRASVLGRTLDLRVSTCPTPHGEKTVMRILDARTIRVPLDELGFSDSVLQSWRGQMGRPHGIVLVTGPTGSGKTTTLYASLQELDLGRLNVSTVEDPVEYHLGGITQIQTHERIGLSFAASLRTLLRQDPDVVMVGEIRDKETATIATQAALTGHLVLSTLHTNDAPSSVTRLINIGIEPYLVSGAVNGVLAQRLVRRLCDHCASPAEPPAEAATLLAAQGLSTKGVRQGEGCDHCRNSGHAGRRGIHELLQLDDTMRDFIASNPPVAAFRQHCIDQGMRTLRQDALEKMAAGLTSFEEVLRVTEA